MPERVRLSTYVATEDLDNLIAEPITRDAGGRITKVTIQSPSVTVEWNYVWDPILVRLTQTPTRTITDNA